jgi:3-hydroxybutyryl-CoA dehydrogenase
MSTSVEPGAVVVVVGAGTMGRDIALIAVASGYEVRLVDTNPDVRAAAEERITTRLGRVQVADRAPGSLTTGGDLVAALDGAGAVIEAVPELPAVKHAIFETLGAHAAPGTLLASNTSTLSIGDLAIAAGGSDRVVGMHFFNPAHRMALVEVVTAASTSDASRADALALCRHLGKEPIVVADVPGFVTSRLGLVLGNEAMRIVEEGTASAGDVDTAMRLGYNHPMGPLELADLVGLDARLNNLRSVSERMGRADLQPPKILVELVEAGRLGRKTGEGFFRYDADGKRVSDPVGER